MGELRLPKHEHSPVLSHLDIRELAQVGVH